MKGNQIIVLTVGRDGRMVQRGRIALCQRRDWAIEGVGKSSLLAQKIKIAREMGHPRGMVTSELVAYVDGGCLGNPGPSGIGVVISGCESGPVRIAKWIGRQDNNVAEYAALLEALQCAISLKAKALHVYSDSQVVVRQMLGEYTCCSPRL